MELVNKHKKAISGYNTLLKYISNTSLNLDFTNTLYFNIRTNIKVVCLLHGEFSICPRNLLTGSGCPTCGSLRQAKSKLKTNTMYIQEVVSITKGEIINVSPYISAKTKISHLHKSCGNIWEASPDSILRGRGCPKCAKYGFNKTLPATLYYLSINNGEAYKIGITNRDVHARFAKEELERIKILSTWEFLNGNVAYIKEQEILAEYAWAKYTGDNILIKGNTELFYTDILYLDKQLRYN